MQNCWRICQMDNRQVAFALGLAQKAGKVAAGDFAVRSALNGGKAKLMLIASVVITDNNFAAMIQKKCHD